MYVSHISNSKQIPLTKTVQFRLLLTYSIDLHMSQDTSIQLPNLQPDISNVHHSMIDEKYNLIKNGEPDSSFKFPARQYKNKRAKTGVWNLLLALCILFSDSVHRCPKELITFLFCQAFNFHYFLVL